MCPPLHIAECAPFVRYKLFAHRLLTDAEQIEFRHIPSSSVRPKYRPTISMVEVIRVGGYHLLQHPSLLPYVQPLSELGGNQHILFIPVAMPQVVVHQLE